MMFLPNKTANRNGTEPVAAADEKSTMVREGLRRKSAIVLRIFAVLVIIVPLVGQFIFSFMRSSFIPADWVSQASIPAGILLSALTVAFMIFARNFRHQTVDVKEDKNRSLLGLIGVFLFSLLVNVGFLSSGLPWAYTKLLGAQHAARYEVEQLDGRDRKYCWRVHFKSVEEGDVCVQSIFPITRPEIGELVLLSGKLSAFGFLVEKGEFLDR